MAQRRSGSNCTQGTPAGFPCGIPGMALLIDGAMQQAAQPGRQARVLSAEGAVELTARLSPAAGYRRDAWD